MTLWERRCVAMCRTAYRIIFHGMPGGEEILGLDYDVPVNRPTTRRTASVTASAVPGIRLKPVSSLDPTKAKKLVTDSFAYVAAQFFRDVLFSPTAEQLLNFNGFKSFCNKLDFSRFSWILRIVDAKLLRQNV